MTLGTRYDRLLELNYSYGFGMPRLRHGEVPGSTVLDGPGVFRLLEVVMGNNPLFLKVHSHRAILWRPQVAETLTLYAHK